MDVRSRNEVVDKHRYCVNCLAKSHDLRACASLDTCRRCGRYHHTLLHPNIKTRLHRGARPPKSTTAMNNLNTSSTEPHKKPKQKKPKKAKPPQKAAVPDERIISEAIRSLANVLCGQK